MQPNALGGGIVVLLDGALGCNGCKAFRFFDRSRQGIQVLKTLLSGLAEAFLKKHESKRVWAHTEQHFESILDSSRSYIKKNIDTRLDHVCT
jgi:hypothetical protein